MTKYLTAAILVLLLNPWFTPACLAETTIGEVRFGIAGRFKVGYWTRVRVELESDAAVSGTVEIGCADGDGFASFVRSEPIQLTAGEPTTAVLLTRFGRSSEQIRVSFEDQEGNRVSKSVRLPTSDEGMTLASEQIVLSLGADIDIASVESSRAERADRNLVSAHVSEADELPDDWLSYNGIDVIILSTGDLSLMNAMTDQQLDAVDQWVQMGGALIISAAANAETLFFDEGRLARLRPGEFVQTTRQAELRGLEDFSESKQRIDTASSDGAAIAIFKNIAGTVESSEGFGTELRPNVIRYAHGFGQVVFLAHDLDDKPLADWAGRTRLIALLLSSTMDRIATTEQGGGLGQVSHLGFDDLTGQLRAALDQFSGGQLMPFSLVAVLAGVYILLIGPFDFYLLRWLRQRMEWTWLTFPLLVASFCGLAYYMATTWKGTQTRINQLDIMDVDLAQSDSLVRGHSWAHVYSSHASDFNFSLACGSEQLKIENRMLAWQGLSGRHFGGMDGRGNVDHEGKSCQLVISDAETKRSELQGFAIPVWSSRSLSAIWWDRAMLDCEHELTADSRDDLLDGFAANPLDASISDAWLFYDRWAYRLGKIQPRQRIDIPSGYPRNVEVLLTGRRSVDQKQISTPWQKSSRDVEEIAMMMMLHEAALGRSYTNLLNRYQRTVDISSHLELGRAVLIGKLERPVTELTDSGRPMTDQYDQRWTYCRVVFPVKRTQE